MRKFVDSAFTMFKINQQIILPMLVFLFGVLVSSCGSSSEVSQLGIEKAISGSTRDARGHRPGPTNFTTIVIDAGHGGRDPGAVVNGVREKVLALDINHGSSSSLIGPETYYFRVDSYSLAKRLQRAMEGVSPSTKSRGLVRRRLRLTRNPEIPSVLLELGYLSNSSDRARLSQASYRQHMASAIAQAIRDQNKYGDKGMGALPAPLNKPLSRPADRSEL